MVRNTDTILARCPETDGDLNNHQLNTDVEPDVQDGEVVLIVQAACDCGWQDKRVLSE